MISAKCCWVYWPTPCSKRVAVVHGKSRCPKANSRSFWRESGKKKIRAAHAKEKQRI
jgi:hypothetical protein